ncbi:MAG: TAXI family TRAP transporter solute-binding subunit [Candidatus Atribacteria bacterium]|nr:TAXI family TRAP transporter solute-binding subunit [Candidatus Atribacteria bacterium]
MKRFGISLLILVIIFIFTGSASLAQMKYVSISTGSTGGTFYPAGAIIASTFNEYLGDSGYKWSAQASGGSLENLEMLRNKEAQMAIVGSAPSNWAYTGSQDFEGKAIKNIRYMTALWPEMTQIIYRKGIGIEGWKDLKGKKVAVGPAGGSYFYSRIILKATAGLTFDDIIPEYMSYGDSVQALQDRLIDAAYLAAGIPTSAVSQAYAGRVEIDILEFSDEELARLHEAAPFYVRGVIEKDTYPGQDRDLQVAANPSALLVEQDMPEDIVYSMLDAMYLKGLEEMKKQHHSLTFLSLEGAIEGLSGAPLHAGAVKFYKDHGINIPGDLIPPEMK